MLVRDDSVVPITMEYDDFQIPLCMKLDKQCKKGKISLSWRVRWLTNLDIIEEFLYVVLTIEFF